MDPTEQPVSSVMAPDFASVSSADRLDFVEDVMQLGRIRHMPVIDDGKLVGVVSQRDLLAASLSRALDFEAQQRRSFMRSVEVGEVMVRNPITISPEASLRAAAALVLRHKVGCLMVVDATGRPVGLVTETDLLRGVYDEQLVDAVPEDTVEGTPGAG
jgi:CBS domain-containing protein